MPEKPIDIRLALAQAEGAVDHARRVREYHRRRTDKRSPQRRADVRAACSRLKEAMKPLKSEIGRFPYGAQTDAAEAERERVREASAAIQSERRKLWKMVAPEDRSGD